MSTRTSLPRIAALACAGFVAGWVFMPRGDDAGGPPRTEAHRLRIESAELERMQRALERERARREALESRLAEEVPAPPDAPGPELEIVAPDSLDERRFASDGPPTPEELREELERFGAGLRKVLYGHPDAAGIVERLRDAYERAGPEAVRGLIGRFLDETEGLQARVVIAHALGQIGSPEAIALLQTSVRDTEAGMMVQRFASHALAFSEAEGLEPFLLQAARDAADRGVRANLSFGLARRGATEGLELYAAATDEAFESGDPEAIQYLGGFALLGERGAPLVRERLLSYGNEQALLFLIEITKGNRDLEALPQLRQLAYDASRPTSVQRAALGAMEVLKKAPGPQAPTGSSH